MALLNYTTKVSTVSTIAEIHSILVSSGATAIMSEYDANKNVTAIFFKANTEFGIVSFKLPCNVQSAQTVLNKQVNLKQIPKRYFNDAEQARRIAWRIIKDWLAAQLALISLGMAKIEQVFLPYAQCGEGETIYDQFRIQKFKTLTLNPLPELQDIPDSHY